MDTMSKIWRVLTRKKVIDPIFVEDTRLSRVLGTFDLTALGVGSTLGVGVYVLAGKVAKDTAGPSVILSFLIAAVVSVFAGLCYAEFGARAPRAGSAYIYSYVCVGEFAAFVIGWNLILEYVIGSASVARGLSLYLDTLLNNTLENTFKEIAPIHVSFMSEYFDFLAFGISILLAIALAFGLKESSLANNIFTSLNIFIVIFVVITGSIKADTSNWNIKPDNNSTNSTIIGKGGFFPFGIEGTIKGAATCFYGFVGFDCIATTGEEVRNPKKAIPVSIILSLGIIFLAYFGISTVLTLMVPYYLQNAEAPIPDAFDSVGWNWAKWVVAIGGICGLLASLFGAMFPLPRIIYAMASDGLVFKILGRVNTRFQTPVIGTLLAGILTGLMAALFELSQLVNMMSIGTLMAYTVVAASVLLLRFTVDDNKSYKPVRVNSDSDDNEPYTDNITSFMESLDDDSGMTEYGISSSTVGQIFNCSRHSQPTKSSQNIVAVEVFLYCITCVCIGLSALYLKDPISNGQTWAIVLASCTIFVACVLVMSIATQPTSSTELSFKVPMVPLIPALSILANIYLMLMLDSHTWIRFGVWMAVGLPIYYLSLKPPDEPKPKDTPTENHTNGNQNGKANYYDNVAFIGDTTLANATQSKKKPAPLPPQSISEDKIEVIEIQQELEKLDEMLDEVAKDIDSIRKSSAGSVSVSMSREENVVADVHCDNVLTPAITTPPNTPLNSPTTPTLISVTPLEVQNNAAPSEDDITPNRSGSVDTPVPPDTPESSKSIQGDSDFTTSPLEISPTTTPPPSPILAPKLQDNLTELPEKSVNSAPPPELIDEPLKPAPPPEFLDEPVNSPPPPKVPEDSVEINVAPSPPPLPTESITQEVFQKKEPSPIRNRNSESPLTRVTSNDIKRVTLKAMKKPKQAPEKQFEPDDDNLKPGSEKAKSFKEKLNSKLANIHSLPSYIPILRPRTSTPKSEGEQNKDYKKNENVIEDSINRDEAKEKLGLYINSRISYLDTSIKQPVDSPLSEQNSPLPSPCIEINGTVLQDDNSDEPVVEIADEDYLVYQNRMKNVFRSLKHTETSKDPTSPNRIVKSLEHKLDDKAKHRQAMTEIFKTIQLRRKESALQQSKV